MKFLVKTIVSMILTAIALIPSGIFYGAYLWLNPQDFFEKVATFILGILIFGNLQVLFGIVWFAGILYLWTEDKSFLDILNEK